MNFRPPPWIFPQDFHILHSAYVYICYSTLKAKTYNSLPNTHTHTHMTSNSYKQKATGHVASLANGHITGSDAPFVCEIPTASSNNFVLFCFVVVVADIGLAVGTPAGFAPTKECFKCSRRFGKRHKTDAFTKLGEPTIRAACTPQTVLGRLF